LAGATVIRGFLGFGKSSHMHAAKILRLSMDLPMVVEIVDVPEKVSIPCLSGTNDERRPSHTGACTRNWTPARNCPKANRPLISASCMSSTCLLISAGLRSPSAIFVRSSASDFQAMDSVFAKKGKID